MEKRNYGNGSIYKRQDGRWVAAVCSCDPATGKSIRSYYYGKTKQEVLRKKMELIAKSKKLPFTLDLNAKHS